MSDAPAATTALVAFVLAVAPALGVLAREFRHVRAIGLAHVAWVCGLPALVGAALVAWRFGEPRAALVVAASAAAWCFAWLALDLACGAGRIGALLGATAPMLAVLAAFHANAFVEASPGVLVASAAPVILAWSSPVPAIAEHALADPLWVRRYFYYASDVRVPSPARLQLVHVAVGVALFGVARLMRRVWASRASPDAPLRRSPS